MTADPFTLGFSASPLTPTGAKELKKLTVIVACAPAVTQQTTIAIAVFRNICILPQSGPWAERRHPALRHRPTYKRPAGPSIIQPGGVPPPAQERNDHRTKQHGAARPRAWKRLGELQKVNVPNRTPTA